MLEVAGGILLALGILFVGLIVLRNFRVIGMAICAVGVLAVVALSMGG